MLHAALLANLLRSPALFYDVTPLGRIMNRVSKDMDTIDSRLRSNIGDVLYCSLRVAGAVFVIGGSTPWVLLVFPVLAVLYVQIQVPQLVDVALI